MAARYTVSVGSAYTGHEIEPGLIDRSTSTFADIDWLEALYLSYGCNGTLGTVVLRAHKLPEDAYSLVSKGAPIKITDTTTGPPNVVVFDGIIQKVQYEISGNRTEFKLVCFNAGDDILRRICVYGQYRLGHTKEQYLWDHGITTGLVDVSSTTEIFLTDCPLIFNPQGEPNMSKQKYSIDGDSSVTINLFDIPFRNQHGPGGDLKSDFWTLKAAVKYLLNLYNCDWALDATSYDDTVLDAIFTANGNPVVSNINCEGKSITQALDCLLTPHNYIWYVDSLVDVTTSKLKFKLSFKGAGATKALILSAHGTHAADSTANVLHLDITEDCTAIVNNVIAKGDQKIFTILAHTDPTGNELKLVQGWETGDLTYPAYVDGAVNVFDPVFIKNYCHTTNLTLLGGKNVGGVGRLWLVNLGEVKGSPLEDLSLKLDDTSDVNPAYSSINPRRLEKPELYQQTSAGGLLKQENIIVEMSLDNGDNWAIIEKDWYQIVPDMMGILFSNPKLNRLGKKIKNSIYTSGTGYWRALNEATLQIRILCSVKSDERVTKQIDNSGATTPLATRKLFSNDGYRKIIYDGSISSAIYYTGYPPLTPAVDDTAKLATIAQQQADLTDKVMVHGSAVVLYDNIGDWVPGQSITGITGRSITYTTGKLPTIVNVAYDLVAQHCQIALDNHDVALIIKSKSTSEASDRNEAKLGIGNVTSYTGGNKVNAMPWASNTRAERRENQGE
jgi:hypothetical protein